MRLFKVQIPVLIISFSRDVLILPVQFTFSFVALSCTGVAEINNPFAKLYV